MLAAICSGVCGTVVGGACSCALGARGFLEAAGFFGGGSVTGSSSGGVRSVQSVLQGFVRLSLAYSYSQGAVRGVSEVILLGLASLPRSLSRQAVP